MTKPRSDGGQFERFYRNKPRVDDTAKRRESLKMLEKLPAKGIIFNELFGGRLDKHGIETKMFGDHGVLIDRDGRSAVVKPTTCGGAEFSAEMSPTIIAVLAKEFAVDLSYNSFLTHVVIDCSNLTYDVVPRWLSLASSSDALIASYAAQNPKFADLVSRMKAHIGHDRATQVAMRQMPGKGGAIPIDFPGAIGLGKTAWVFGRHAIARGGALSLDLFNSLWSTRFAMLVAMGLFVRLECRYRPALPSTLSVETAKDAMERLLETQDAEAYLHPERYLVTMRSRQAKLICEQLRRQAQERADENWEDALEIDAPFCWV
jgi:hypothetical protein